VSAGSPSSRSRARGVARRAATSARGAWAWRGAHKGRRAGDRSSRPCTPDSEACVLRPRVHRVRVGAVQTATGVNGMGMTVSGGAESRKASDGRSERERDDTGGLGITGVSRQ
jgi:hypothetical protein